VQNVLQITPYRFSASTAKKFCISTDRTTTVRSHCTTDVQPMYSSVQHPMVPSFHILCGPFAKVVLFTISTNFKVSSTLQVSHHFTGRCDWLQSVQLVRQSHRRSHELNMFNSCDTGQNCCRMTAAVTVAVATNCRDNCIV